MKTRRKEIPIISFYSYKGGSGRSVATVNCIGYLAEKIEATPEKPLLVMDMDVDSAGITSIISKTREFANINTSKLLKQEIILSNDIKRKQFMAALQDITQKVMGKQAEKGTVLFLGNDLKGAEKALSPRVIGPIKRQLIKSFSGIVMDSASGRQPAAHICYRMSNIIVCCCRLSPQHIWGTRFQLQHYREELKKNHISSQFILLPVAVPKTPDDKDLKIYMNKALGDLAALAKRSSAVLIKDGVPEVESLKWQEFILRTKERLAEDEKKAIGAYELLADTIVKIVPKQ